MPQQLEVSHRKWIPTSWVIMALDVIQFGAVALVVLPITIGVWWIATAIFGARGRP